MGNRSPDPDTAASRGRSDPAAVAEAVRRACIEAALRAAEDAGIRGLCAEGRLDAAIDAIRALDLEDLVPVVDRPDRSS